MRRKSLFSLFVLFSLNLALYAADEGDFSGFDKDLNERDFSALREFVNSKRAYGVKEKWCALNLSGDVRTEWRHMTEKRCGGSQRGGNAHDCKGLPISKNDFDIEANLKIDYSIDNAWASFHLQFDNTAGVRDSGKSCKKKPSESSGCSCCDLGDRKGCRGSGSDSDINLKKAYIGFNLFQDCDSRFDVEIGRRPLYNLFDSKVQFLSRFDGIALKYDSRWEGCANWYGHLGAFVIDERVNHFGFVTEFGLLNIVESGFDGKYSFIDWSRTGKNRCGKHNPRGCKFRNSQFTTAYHFVPPYLCLPATLYAALIWNHDAKRWKDKAKKSHGKANLAWYMGAIVGKVLCEGDWSWELRYEYVQAQSVPDRDLSGIGRGNVLSECFTNRGRGNTNYRGIVSEFLYALTDNLSIDAVAEYSIEIKKAIGGSHEYSKMELELIYAF